MQKNNLLAAFAISATLSTGCTKVDNPNYDPEQPVEVVPHCTSAEIIAENIAERIDKLTTNTLTESDLTPAERSYIGEVPDCLFEECIDSGTRQYSPVFVVDPYERSWRQFTQLKSEQVDGVNSYQLATVVDSVNSRSSEGFFVDQTENFLAKITTTNTITSLNFINRDEAANCELTRNNYFTCEAMFADGDKINEEPCLVPKETMTSLESSAVQINYLADLD